MEASVSQKEGKSLKNLFRVGYYTEIIFGARLKKDTPKNIIDTLRYVSNGGYRSKDEDDNIISNDPIVIVDKKLIEEYDLWAVMHSGSYYFGVSSPVSKMWYDTVSNEWTLSFRSNCKNRFKTVAEPTSDDEQILQRFVKFIKPYVKKGSGDGDIYAIITTEDGEPNLYGLRHNYTTLRVDEKDLKNL